MPLYSKNCLLLINTWNFNNSAQKNHPLSIWLKFQNKLVKICTSSAKQSINVNTANPFILFFHQRSLSTCNIVTYVHYLAWTHKLTVIIFHISLTKIWDRMGRSLFILLNHNSKTNIKNCQKLHAIYRSIAVILQVPILLLLNETSK